MLNETFDLFFTEDGEILFDEDKRDIERAYESEGEILIQTVLKRLQSVSEDWNIKGVISSNLEYLRGSARSEGVEDEAIQMVYGALVADKLVVPESIRISTEGYHENMLLINVTIFGEQNRLLNTYNLGFSYDMRSNRCIPRYVLGKGVRDG